eukprot:CFRG2030T1
MTSIVSLVLCVLLAFAGSVIGDSCDTITATVWVGEGDGCKGSGGRKITVDVGECTVVKVGSLEAATMVKAKGDTYDVKIYLGDECKGKTVFRAKKHTLGDCEETDLFRVKTKGEDC